MRERGRWPDKGRGRWEGEQEGRRRKGEGMGGEGKGEATVSDPVVHTSPRLSLQEGRIIPPSVVPPPPRDTRLPPFLTPWHRGHPSPAAARGVPAAGCAPHPRRSFLPRLIHGIGLRFSLQEEEEGGGGRAAPIPPLQQSGFAHTFR